MNINYNIVDSSDDVSPWNIRELKKANLWEKRKYISATGLVPYVKALGEGIKGLEIGVASAWNMNHFLTEIPELCLIGVDPYIPFVDWNNAEHTQELLDSQYMSAIDNISEFSDRSLIFKCKSQDMHEKFDDGELDYIFIDGDHSYNAVLDDCNNFYSKVRSGGIFSGHDSALPAVVEALKEFRKDKNLPEIQYTDNYVWFWIKE
jgi:hypothetical protein